MTEHPPLQIVDKDDNPIGGASMDEVHKKGLWHRIVAVIVLDNSGRILLQKRSDKVFTNPKLWDASAAGHVDVDEDYLTAAHRELFEEIGLKNVDLEEVLYFKSVHKYEWRILNRYKKVYLTRVDLKTEFKINPEEIDEVKWFTPNELQALISESPEKIVSDFVEVLEKVRDKL